ncbi:hypothetical protein FXO37_23735 [Capsicum annuum]|nr:hypothetical protein FXO37_23735 [Capsicum annuum]
MTFTLQLSNNQLGLSAKKKARLFEFLHPSRTIELVEDKLTVTLYQSNVSIIKPTVVRLLVTLDIISAPQRSLLGRRLPICGYDCGATSIASTSRVNAPQPMAHVKKPEKFAGIDFKRWQQKMFFYLTTLCLQKFTSEDAPEVLEGTSDKEHFMIVEAWKHSDFLCRNYILSGLQDDLYNVYKDNKAAERRSKENSAINGAHIVEDDQNNSKKRKKVEQGSNQPKKKFKGKCFNCGKISHKSTDCRTPKKDKKKNQANMIESNKECDDLCAMFSECNLVGNPREWWMDYDTTRHVCANKELFSSFAPAQVEEMIYMANSATAKVEETEKICLKMTSGKVLTLKNVLYVPKSRRNLISVSLLDKNGFKCVTVSGNIVISKGEIMLESKFDMKDLGVADVILGIRIHQTPQGLALSQSHYIKNVLDKFKYMEFGIAKTPLDVSFALRKNEDESDSQLEYARVLGCLMYIMNCTRPDITCAISKLSRYTSNPNKTHWMAMKRVLGYLKYIQDYALYYNKYPAVLEGYSDVNWITGSNELKSTSGYVFTIGGGVVSWKSSKQTCIARSTMES